VEVRRALISVSDKTGVVDFARALVALGIEIVSSGGTAAALAAADVAVKRVSEVTGAPEILDGRVKTLHPKIHGGILADRSKTSHQDELARAGIEPIDLVVCNLYPFERTAADPGASEEDVIDQIDVGGPAMVRAAAKNFHSVAVVTNPTRYATVADELERTKEVSPQTRRALALEAFSHTASYDAAISSYLAGGDWPEMIVLGARKVANLRYGENPHQGAALYARSGAGIATAEQLAGKELSYNNLLDVDAAVRLASELPGTGAAIVKHSNPCGVALGDDLASAHAAALDCDRTSAFGGIVALNRACDSRTAEKIIEIFTEVVAAPDYDAAALEVLRTRKNLRVLRAPGEDSDLLELRSISGGLLVQAPDRRDRAEDATVVTDARPTAAQWDDLRLAWIVAKHVKSNAIVLVRDGVAVGIGAGQMSRVESTDLAARRAGARARGTACASDAFFPFRDGLDAAVAAGAAAVIQPGGSIRDDEVIAAANEHGIPMVFTGRRHFRH
jgi:phosphoribosylaminoimidazolecarboxamide formyltransferase/IMP cyclohydrolase